MQLFAFNPARSKTALMWQFRERWCWWWWIRVGSKWECWDSENGWSGWWWMRGIFRWRIVDWCWFPFLALRMSFGFSTRDGWGWERCWVWYWWWIGLVVGVLSTCRAQRIGSRHIGGSHILTRFSWCEWERRWVDCRRIDGMLSSWVSTRGFTELVQIWWRWRCRIGMIRSCSRWLMV